jgi:hypothetical protein
MKKITLTDNRTLIVTYDDCAESPREWDNLTKMLFFGKHKHLGDKHNINADDYNGWNELEEAIKKEYDVVMIKKVYAYIHSGMTISTQPFSCPWDSGVLGFVIITKADLRKEYNWKVLTQKRINEVYNRLDNIMDGEVKVLDYYVSGDVYGFRIEDKNGDIEDSCYGFYGYDIQNNGILDYMTDKDKKLVLEQF